MNLVDIIKANIKVSTVTVNTSLDSGEYTITDPMTLDGALIMISGGYPDWTSAVITIVPKKRRKK